MDTIRVLIADDHPLFRFGLRARLGAEAQIEVVGEAASGEEAVALAASLDPDVILMDVNLPGINGIEATQRILRAAPHIGILILTMFDDDSVFAAMRSGARGYLLKGAEGDETVRAIVTIAHGEAIFSPSVAQRLMRYFDAPRPLGPQVFPELSEREREVLTLIARGLTNAAIASQLVISPKTVRNHVSNIFHKLQVSDRANAIIRARDAGLS